jgi:hypothetical protein
MDTADNQFPFQLRSLGGAGTFGEPTSHFQTDCQASTPERTSSLSSSPSYSCERPSSSPWKSWTKSSRYRLVLSSSIRPKPGSLGSSRDTSCGRSMRYLSLCITRTRRFGRLPPWRARPTACDGKNTGDTKRESWRVPPCSDDEFNK